MANSEQKKTRRRTGGLSSGKWWAALRERLRNLGGKFDRARVIAFDAVQLVTSLQHAIELVDEHGNCLVAII